MPGPLDGIKILEFTQIIAGPFGGMLLADMGADVIKIEPLEGRTVAGLRFQFIPEESKTYMSLNRGKRSLPARSGDAGGRGDCPRHDARRRTSWSSTRARTFPPSWGLTTTKRCPPSTRASSTATTRRSGAAVPHSYRPGYDLIIQAMTGLMAAEGKIQDGVPRLITLDGGGGLLDGHRHRVGRLRGAVPPRAGRARGSALTPACWRPRSASRRAVSWRLTLSTPRTARRVLADSERHARGGRVLPRD